MERSEGNMSLKNPVTPPGIDPGTVRLVVQRLNHYATPGPLLLIEVIKSKAATLHKDSQNFLDFIKYSTIEKCSSNLNFIKKSRFIFCILFFKTKSFWKNSRNFNLLLHLKLGVISYWKEAENYVAKPHAHCHTNQFTNFWAETCGRLGRWSDISGVFSYAVCVINVFKITINTAFKCDINMSSRN
jgi:hypothetical protein